MPLLDPAAPPLLVPRWAWASLWAGTFGLAWLSAELSHQPGSMMLLNYGNAWALAWASTRARTWRLWGAVLAVVALSHGAAALSVVGARSGLSLLALMPQLVSVAVGGWALQPLAVAQGLAPGLAPWARLVARGVVAPALAGATMAWLGAAWGEGHGAPTQWVAWFEGAVLSGLVMLPLALGLVTRSWRQVWQSLGSLEHLALQALTLGIAWLAVALLPMPFAYLALPLMLTAVLTDGLALAAVTFGASLAVQMALGTGVFVPPPISGHWEEALVMLPLVMTLLPAQVLGAVLGSLRQGQAELRAAVDRLAAANEGLEQFVHVASHDLREPLNSMAGLISLIDVDHGTALPDPARGYLHMAQRSVAQLRTLVDDMLAYVRLGRDVASAREPVCLQTVWDDAVLLLNERIRQSGAEVSAQGLDLTLPGHPMMLGLLLQNLLSNALKFVPSGAAPAVEVRAQPEGAQVHLSVRDQGIGIAAEDRQRLFVAFSRLHLRKHYDGTGLGLALCRRVVQLHGGSIWIDSALGRGTTVHVLLPAAAGTATATAGGAGR